MKLKRKLTAEAFAKLETDFQKGLYKEQEDGSYILDVEASEKELKFDNTMDDFAKMRRGKDREAQTAKDLREELDTLKDSISNKDDADLRKKGDIDLLDKSWQEKFTKQETESKDRITKANGFIKKTLVDSVAKTMASEISTSPEVILPHITKRLMADFDGESPVTKVVDKDGNPSALTIEELKVEFIGNEIFSGIIKQSNASGGGAGGGGNNSGGAKSLKDMNRTEEAKYANENPAEYKKMVAAADKAKAP